MNDDSPRAPLITHMLGPVDWNWIEQEVLPLSVGVYLGADPTCITRGQIKSISLFRPTERNFLYSCRSYMYFIRSSAFFSDLARTRHGAAPDAPALPHETATAPARSFPQPALYHRSFLPPHQDPSP